VFICDECVELCNDIIREETGKPTQERSRERAADAAAKSSQVLDEYVIGQEQRQAHPVGGRLQPLQAPADAPAAKNGRSRARQERTSC
jgi:hypothetical protein